MRAWRNVCRLIHEFRRLLIMSCLYMIREIVLVSKKQSKKGDHVMRYGFKLKIRPGTEEEYIIRHQNVHGELLQAFKEYGIKTYSIFMDGTTLFGYIEADDVTESMRRIGETKANVIWQQFMADIIINEEGSSGELKEVFYITSDEGDRHEITFDS